MQQVRDDVSAGDVTLVSVDSLNGYLNAMPEEKFLILQLHELLSYLGQKGITTLLIVAQHGMLGSAMGTPVDVSYLADTVMLFRLFELNGALKQSMSIGKRRAGPHDRSIREILYGGSSGIELGPPCKI